MSSCATYYQKNLEFQTAFTQGDLEKADKLLDKNKKAAEGKNRLLYFLQKGVVLQMQGQFELSNQYFEQAYTFVEDFKTKPGLEALAVISNQNVKPYKGEDHEKVLIHYYKALNFLQLKQPQEALVEAKRLNNKLNLLNDTYEDRKNRYKDDAFAHILMGMAYEMDNDPNNAFIAYRNAFNTYKESYSPNFGVQAPEQLKQDLMRTAYLTGFRQELRQYEKEFGTEYSHDKSAKNRGELIFFWHNGLGPIKSEWSINFTIVKGQGGVATFVNDELGLNFTYPLPPDEGDGGFDDLSLVRVAFPKYLSRNPVYQSASIDANGNQYLLEKTENIDAVARYILEDRFLREMGTALLRLAAKQASAYAAREEDRDLGTIVSLVNAITEKADTRNWQTVPNSIYYARIPLEIGDNVISLETMDAEGNKTNQEFTFSVEKGQTLFHLYHSLDSYPPSSN